MSRLRLDGSLTLEVDGQGADVTFDDDVIDVSIPDPVPFLAEVLRTQRLGPRSPVPDELGHVKLRVSDERGQVLTIGSIAHPTRSLRTRRPIVLVRTAWFAETARRRRRIAAAAALASALVVGVLAVRRRG